LQTSANDCKKELREPVTTNPPEADLLLTNGRVDPADPRPTSVAIRGGLIQAIAPDADLAAAPRLHGRYLLLQRGRKSHHLVTVVD